MMVDISAYSPKILYKEDKPIFEEAVKSYDAGAKRAAYILIWISCAESLKRRFKEAQKRDSNAGVIVGEINNKEQNHQSIDKYVLDKAKDYGFLTDTAHNILNHVYEMRCVYGHPYEQAPSDQQIDHAASSVIDHVLSQPVKLKHGFANQLINNLLSDHSYLDDQASVVKDFTEEIIPRIDSSIYVWLLEKYWQELEKMADDPTLNVFVNRGVYFTRTFLKSIGCQLYSKQEWHEKLSTYPKILTRVFSDSVLFKKIGRLAQDYLVGEIIKEFSKRATTMQRLERLYEKSVLSTRQADKFIEAIESAKSKDIYSSNIDIYLCFDRIISDLKSHNWYTQNPAIDYVISNGPDALKNLNPAENRELGRNILQSAEGSSGSAIRFLEEIDANQDKWPLALTEGMLLECFINEKKELRFKIKYLKLVIRLIDKITPNDRKKIIVNLSQLIGKSKLKYNWIDRDEFKKPINLLKKYSWAKVIITSLNRVADKQISNEAPDARLPF